MSKQIRKQQNGVSGIVTALVFVLASGMLTSALEESAHAEDARVLPKGRSRMSLDFAETGDISEEYSANGTATPITAPYNLELSGPNVESVSPALSQLVNYLNGLGYYYHSSGGNNAATAISNNPSGGVPLGNAVSAGFLGVGGGAQQEQYVLSYMYGVTDRLSLGVFIPMLNTNVNVSDTISGSNTAALAYQFFSGGSLIQPQYLSGLQQLAGLNTGTLQSELKSLGYNTFGNYSGGGLGDITLGGRYNYLNESLRHDHDFMMSFQGGLTLPTGFTKDPADITEIGTGQGCFQLAVANIINYTPTPLITLSNALHFSHPLQGHEQLRVADGTSDIIPSAADQEQVGFQMGNSASTNFAMKFNISKAFNVEPAYYWAWKGQDTYWGPLQRDYGYLSLNTDTFQETAALSINLSSVPAFLKYEFPLPLELSVTLYVPTEGRNVIIAPYMVEEIALYF